MYVLFTCDLICCYGSPVAKECLALFRMQNYKKLLILNFHSGLLCEISPEIWNQRLKFTPEPNFSESIHN